MKKVKKASIFFLNDSYYTIGSLICKQSEIALACILCGAKAMDIEYPGRKYYQMDKLKEKMNTENQKYSSNFWFKWLDSDINLENVNRVITLINEFYAKVKIESKV
mmetsp:Transcript_2519/g.2973  ORF Transcript_2519/g.2973 Transcript_2519/m.2973 type:complete len:106 (+) Transcript_2519:561-878(+)